MYSVLFDRVVAAGKCFGHFFTGHASITIVVAKVFDVIFVTNVVAPERIGFDESVVFFDAAVSGDEENAVVETEFLDAAFDLFVGYWVFDKDDGVFSDGEDVFCGKNQVVLLRLMHESYTRP